METTKANPDWESGADQDIGPCHLVLYGLYFRDAYPHLDQSAKVNFHIPVE